MTARPSDRKPADPGNEGSGIPVWDIGVRAFHWLLVAAVGGALVTGFLDQKRFVDAHVLLGTVIAILLLLRVVWGFTGSRYARFSSFVRGPSATLAHARDLLCGRARHYVGHNPLGALMIVGLLTVVTALLATGAVVLGGGLKEGPLAFVTSYGAGHSAKRLHEFLAFVLLGLIALHVAGVLIESLRTSESLVRAMLTGTKRAPPGAVGAAETTSRPWLGAGLGLGILALAASSVIGLSRQPAFGVPTAPLDPTYVRECKSCHAPHHPSLASEASWRLLMAGLDNHFGDNAGLEPAVTAELSRYLTANAAEHWDTLAANRLRKPSPVEPLRITATQGWRRIHRDIPDATFGQKSVGGRVDCASCHGDADTGRFAPRAISIPKETGR